MPIRHSARLEWGLGGTCLEYMCSYMVPVMDCREEVQTIRATSVAQIANLKASLPPSNIEEGFPLARGWGARLARLAGKVDLLIGLDNQMGMSRRISSLMEGANLWRCSLCSGQHAC
jgi:hypothetical protein